MTWAEFLIRLYAYRRIQKNELYKVREICYQIYASNFVGKSKADRPVSKDRYWNIEGNKISVSNNALEALKQAQQKYRDKKNG